MTCVGDGELGCDGMWRKLLLYTKKKREREEGREE